MSFPHVYQLKRPLYLYSEDEHKNDADKLRGMLRHAPYRAARIPQPKCLFVFTESDRDHANQLYLSLRNGIESFPGCKRLTGISLEKDSVLAVKVPEVDRQQLAVAFQSCIEEQLSKMAEPPDFAFVISSKQPLPMEQDPYGYAKVALTRYGIPSQFVSWELLESSNTFRYAISNIALAFFVKLGGVPWSVSVGRKTPALAIGIGSTEVNDPNSLTRRRLLGYAVCVLSNGLYLDTTFFPPANSYPEFLVNLESGLRKALDEVLKSNKDVEKVTIHVSHLERAETIRHVRQTITEYEKTGSNPISLELVRLTEDSDFSVFDQSHPGFVSAEGTVVALGANHALLVTEGRKEKPVWRGRKPVTLELHRQYASSRSLSLRDTIEDAFCLSSVNWRGFNAVTQPISLQYAKLLAQEVAKMSQIQPQICAILQQQRAFSSVPWFI
ncbi:MAG: hypothetical protein M1434_01210 [Chloroflexi bacterium]|nr:hypothetical protein [Chloroflexota bacterium]MCL5273350.1 hypothetical protein [Chloroflexota bacterium]